MKKTLIRLVIVAIPLLLLLVFRNNITYWFHTKDFEKITLSELKDMQSEGVDESSIIYLGRETCPYCRDFVPTLNKASKEEDKNVYYVDTEKIISAEDKEYFTNVLKIEYVPSLIILNKDQELTVIPSEKLVDSDIKDISLIISGNY